MKSVGISDQSLNDTSLGSVSDTHPTWSAFSHSILANIRAYWDSPTGRTEVAVLLQTVGIAFFVLGLTLLPVYQEVRGYLFFGTISLILGLAMFFCGVRLVWCEGKDKHYVNIIRATRSLSIRAARLRNKHRDCKELCQACTRIIEECEEIEKSFAYRKKLVSEEESVEVLKRIKVLDQDLSNTV